MMAWPGRLLSVIDDARFWGWSSQPCDLVLEQFEGSQQSLARRSQSNKPSDD
jgi:hypothetical protein